MTRFFLAPVMVLVSASAAVGCTKADSAEPHAVGAIAGDAPAAAPATTEPQNKTAPAVPLPPPPLTQTEAGANAQGSATLEFKKRVDAYVKIHKQADAKVPSLKKTDDPKEIAERAQALGQMIMTLRAGAQPGEIFAREYQPYLVQIIKDDFKQRSAADRKALVVELPAKMKVEINTIYPTSIPLETFPPILLRKLPDLPPELEYRIVGRSLILRDVKANLVVDIIRDVVPTIPS